MNAIDNSKIQNAGIGLGLLLETLAHAKDLPLVFHYDGHSLKAGYHVTEVKAGRLSALDCGANPEAWSEIFVQFWDIEEGVQRPKHAKTCSRSTRRKPTPKAGNGRPIAFRNDALTAIIDARE